MIVFSNPGLIPLDAIRLMGASVKSEGTFGRFGTGLKYAIATILRGGGSITLWCGENRYDFGTQTVLMKGADFSEVCLIECEKWTPLGFTTQLGKDWEPWMALRELACNARDEGGWWEVGTEDDRHWAEAISADETNIIVDWPEMEEAATGDKEHVFAPAGEVLLEENGVRVLPGPSEYLYHRGVRVWKLSRPSAFTYDVMKPVTLTEDRNVAHSFVVIADVRNMLLQASDETVIAGALLAGDEQWERHFDWEGKDWCPTDPGLTWLEAASDIRNNMRARSLSKSATDVLLTHSAMKGESRLRGGRYDNPSGVFGEAVELLDGIGYDLKEIDVFIADELPGDANSALSKGAVLIKRAFLDEAPRLEMATELLVRYLELRAAGKFDNLMAMTVPNLLNMSWDLRKDREENEAYEAGARPGLIQWLLGTRLKLEKPDLDDDLPF